MSHAITIKTLILVEYTKDGTDYQILLWRIEMKLHIVDFSTWEEHVVSSRNDCTNDTERRLWDMHEQIPSNTWKLGKTLAERID